MVQVGPIFNRFSTVSNPGLDAWGDGRLLSRRDQLFLGKNIVPLASNQDEQQIHGPGGTNCFWPVGKNIVLFGFPLDEVQPIVMEGPIVSR